MSTYIGNAIRALVVNDMRLPSMSYVQNLTNWENTLVSGRVGRVIILGVSHEQSWEKSKDFHTHIISILTVPAVQVFPLLRCIAYKLPGPAPQVIAQVRAC